MQLWHGQTLPDKRSLHGAKLDSDRGELKNTRRPEEQSDNPSDWAATICMFSYELLRYNFL